MIKIWVVGLNSFCEVMCDKIFYTLLFFVVVMILVLVGVV